MTPLLWFGLVLILAGSFCIGVGIGIHLAIRGKK